MAASNDTSTRGFEARHIGPQGAAITTMLERVGAASLDELINGIVPDSIRQQSSLDLPAVLSEQEALDAIRSIAEKNVEMTSLIGMGYTGTIMPPVIRRNVLENPAWYTAYTPYQPEISQGRLEALLNFQTMVCELTGLPVANASLLDEATAAAEAMTMCRRSTKTGDVFFVDHDVHPQILAVLQTRAEPIGISVLSPLESRLCPVTMPPWLRSMEYSVLSSLSHRRPAVSVICRR